MRLIRALRRYFTTWMAWTDCWRLAANQHHGVSFGNDFEVDQRDGCLYIAPRPRA